MKLSKLPGANLALRVSALSLLMGVSAYAQSGSLQIYSAYPDEMMRPLITAFNAQYPDVTVEVSVQPGEQLMSTLELELRANSPRADVVGLNQASLQALQAAHATALEAYTPATLDGTREEVRDPANIVIPACINPYLIQYNTNQITAENAPKNWSELLDPKYKDMIAMADPASSQSVQSFLWFVSNYLPEAGVDGFGWDYFAALGENGVRLESSHGTIRDLTASGERPIGIQLLANGQTSEKRGDPTAIIFPPEGSPGELSGFAMFSGSDNKEAAQAWLDFVVSVEGQTVMPDALGCAPIRNDVAYTLPGGAVLEDTKIVPVDTAFITANREAQSAEFSQVFGQ